MDGFAVSSLAGSLLPHVAMARQPKMRPSCAMSTAKTAGSKHGHGGDDSPGSLTPQKTLARASLPENNPKLNDTETRSRLVSYNQRT